MQTAFNFLSVSMPSFPRSMRRVRIGNQTLNIYFQTDLDLKSDSNTPSLQGLICLVKVSADAKYCVFAVNFLA